MKITESHQFKFAFFSKIIAIIIGIITGVFINRFLGPALKGEYTFLFNLINFFALFLNLGIYQSYPYFQRKDINKNLQKKYINIFFFQFLLYLFIFLLIILICVKDLYLIIILLFLPQYVLGRELSFILLVKRPNLRNLSTIIDQFTFMIFMFFIYLFGERNINYVFLIMFVQKIIIIIVFIFLFRIKVNPLKIDFKHLKKSIIFGFFPMLTSVLIYLNYNIDIFVLKLFISYYDIGIYSVGVGFASMAWFIPDAFKEVLFSKTSKKDSISEIVFSLKINLYLCILIFIAFIIFGEFIIEFLYGTEFIGAYMVVVILFIGNIPMIFYKIIITLFLAQGKKVLVFLIMLVSILFSSFWFFFLISLYGIIGSAIAATISHLVCGLLFLIFFLKFEEVKVKDLLWIKKEDIHFIFREK